MFRKLNFIILSSMSLAIPILAMQDSDEAKKDTWLKIVQTDANFCHLGMTNNPSQMPHFLGAIAEGIKNADEYGKVEFSDEHINPIKLGEGKSFFGLHVAAQYGHVPLVKAYLIHKIDSRKLGPGGKTPKEIAEMARKTAKEQNRQNYTDIISLLEKTDQKE